jgi:hypothetical protein
MEGIKLPKNSGTVIVYAQLSPGSCLGFVGWMVFNFFIKASSKIQVCTLHVQVHVHVMLAT